MPGVDEECVGLEWKTEIEVKPPQTVTFIKRATLTENVEHSLQIATCRGQLEELLSSVDVRFLVTEGGEEKEISEGVFSLGFDTDENYRALIQQCQEQLPDGSMKTLLSYLVGSKAKIVTKGSADCPPESIEADVIGWEMRNITANWIEGEPFVNVLEGASLRGIPLSEIASVQPLEQAKLDTLTRALSLAHLSKTNKGAQVTILASTPLSGVTIECQYSLTLPSVSVTLHKLYVDDSEDEQEESVLQTFSVIKNPTHENWENVSIRYRGDSLEEGDRDSQVISVHASQSALVPVTRRMTVSARVCGVWQAGSSFKALKIHNTTQSVLPAGYLQVFDSSRRMVSRAATRIPRLNIGQKATIPINDLAVRTQQTTIRAYYTTPTAVSIKRGELKVTRDHVQEHALSMTSHEEQPFTMRVQYYKRADTLVGIAHPYYDEVVAHLSPGETKAVAFGCALPHRDSIDLDLPQSVKDVANFLQDDRAVVAHLPNAIVEQLRKLTTLYERYWDAKNSTMASINAINCSAGHRTSLLESIAAVAGTPYAERYAAQLLRIDDEIHRHSVERQTHASEQEKVTSLIRKLTRRLQCSVSIPTSEEDASYQPHVISRGPSRAKNARGGEATFSFGPSTNVRPGQSQNASGGLFGGGGGFGGQAIQGGPQRGVFGGASFGGQGQNAPVFGGRGVGGQSRSQSQSGSGFGSASTFRGQGGLGQGRFGQGGVGQGGFGRGIDQRGPAEQASFGQGGFGQGGLGQGGLGQGGLGQGGFGQGGFGQGGFGQGGFGQGGFGQRGPANQGQGGPAEQASFGSIPPALGNGSGPSAAVTAKPPPGAFQFGFGGRGTGQGGGSGAGAPAATSAFSFGAAPAPQAQHSATSQIPVFRGGNSRATGAAATAVSSVFRFGAAPAQASSAVGEASGSTWGRFSFGSTSSAVGAAVTAPQAGFRISCPPDPTPSTGDRDDGQASSRDSSPNSAFASTNATTAATTAAVAPGSDAFSFGSFVSPITESEAARQLLTTAVAGAFGASLVPSAEGLRFRFGEASPLGAGLPPAPFVKERSVDLSQLGATDHSSAEVSSPFLGAVLRSGEGGASGDAVTVVNPFIAVSSAPSGAEEEESSVESPAVSPAARPADFVAGEERDRAAESAAEPSSDSSSSDSSSSDSSSSSSE